MWARPSLILVNMCPILMPWYQFSFAFKVFVDQYGVELCIVQQCFGWLQKLILTGCHTKESFHCAKHIDIELRSFSTDITHPITTSFSYEQHILCLRIGYMELSIVIDLSTSRPPRIQLNSSVRATLLRGSAGGVRRPRALGFEDFAATTGEVAWQRAVELVDSREGAVKGK